MWTSEVKVRSPTWRWLGVKIREPTFWERMKNSSDGLFFHVSIYSYLEIGALRKNKQRFLIIFILLLALAGFISLIVLFVKHHINNLPEKEGVFMEKEDAFLLFGYLCCKEDEIVSKSISTEEIMSYIQQDLNDNHEMFQKQGEDASNKTEEQSYVTKAEAFYMMEILKTLYPTYEGEIIRLSEQVFSDYKKNDSHLLASDFLSFYESLFHLVHPDRVLMEKSLIPLAYGADCMVLNEENAGFESVSGNEMAYTVPKQTNPEVMRASFAQGYLDFYGASSDHLFQNQTFLLCDQVVLLNLSDYYDVKNEDFSIASAFIVSNQPNSLLIEYQDYQLNLRVGDGVRKTRNGEIYDSFENVADLYFSDGALSYLEIYTNSVSGKLLCISDTGIELEGVGTFLYDDRLPVYKLYGKKEFYTKTDLKIGYDFTDFILNPDGKIVAALVTREENMDSIRVVVKTSSFASAYHESITLSCDQDYFVNDVRYPAGDEFCINRGDELLKNGRVHIRPETNLARTTISSINRDQGIPSYRGDFEIVETPEGLLLINELLLEEYLYSVVPSEMPSSYPMEALKAQAVSARTYAYDKMLHSGLQSYGAHVDDSAAFQVYNNIKENENTTLAIRETKDMILTKDGKPAEVYYYSTSCGFGTDIDAWHGSQADQYRYIISRRLSDLAFSGDIKDENTFREYLSAIHAEDFEAQEGWYRWTYDSVLNLDRLNQNILKRYEAGSKNVQTLNAAGEYEQINPPVFSKVERMEVLKREDGGVIDELLISGPEGSIKVIGEHNVRSVLANDGDHVVRADQSTSTVTSLLPSAFCYIDVAVDTETNSISSYHIAGGGYGHGIGMSQNGARAMANRGFACHDILLFFFADIMISEL